MNSFSISDSENSSDGVSKDDNRKKDTDSDSDTTIISSSIGYSAQTFDILQNTSDAEDKNEPLSGSGVTSRWDSNKFDYKCSLLNMANTDPELEYILKKYSGDTQSQNDYTDISSNTKEMECIELSSDEETNIPVKDCKLPSLLVSNIEPEDDVEMTLTELSQKYNFSPCKTVLNENDSPDDNSLIQLNNCKSPKRKRSKISPIDKERKKLEKAAEKARKKEEVQNAKLIKQALATANKNMKPENCMKFITVLLDMEIAHEDYGGEVLNALQEASLTYRLESQLVPKIVTWSRTVENQELDSNGKLQQKSETFETEHALLLMNWGEAVELIHKKEFCEHVKSLQSILNNKELFLGIYGMQGYFNYQKAQKQKNLRNDVTQTVQQTTSKDSKTYKYVPKISKDDLEFALTEVQILCSCSHQLLETKMEVRNLITHFTKAVAQAPFKSEKHHKQQQADHYVWEDNKNVVHVAKNGAGLQKLWQQQLMSFPLARIEHAEAIISKFPTLQSLMEEYSTCSETAGEKLLQDIPIRRAAGPLTTVRKIGPELSKKIYTVLTSLDSSVVI